MTDNQWKMLDILRCHGRQGTLGVLIHWGGYDYGETDAEEARAWQVTKLTVASVVRSLVKMGYVTDENGYEITDAGRAALRERCVPR